MWINNIQLVGANPNPWAINYKNQADDLVRSSEWERSSKLQTILGIGPRARVPAPPQDAGRRSGAAEFALGYPKEPPPDPALRPRPIHSTLLAHKPNNRYVCGRLGPHVLYSSTASFGPPRFACSHCGQGDS